jgi:small GTP-binding protein
MLSLLPAVRVLLSCKQVKANVLVLGLANSGKTTLVNCLMEAGDQEVVPTVGFSMEKVHFDRCKLTVIDMSGQEKYQPLWEMHYTDAKVCIARDGSNSICGSVLLMADCQEGVGCPAAVQHTTAQLVAAAAGTNS